jgi:uncharacterized protein YbaR (Trm112 family)/ubiquinone/menaquinone biosynthesis C-methylase UbiE
LKRRLLDYLVCPDCKQALDCEVTREEGEEIIEGHLTCPSCHYRYPIIEAIPNFLKRETLTAKEHQVAHGFGYKWKRNPEMLQAFRDQFLYEIQPMDPTIFEGQIILDACCGIGTVSNICLEHGAREVIGFDISESIHITRENNRAFPNAHFVQADIFSMPFKSDFDHVICVAAVHVTKDPRRAFRELVERANGNGRVTIWVYGKEGNELVIKFIDPIRKYITAGLPPWMVEFISLPLALILWVIVRGVYAPCNSFRFLRPLSSSLPLNEYLMYTSQWPFKKLFEMVVDQLVSPFTYYYSGEELEEWYRSEGLTDISVNQIYRNSWNATGRKSQAASVQVGGSELME